MNGTRHGQSREREEVESETRKDGATERGQERGRKGYVEGGKLQGMYPEEDTGQTTRNEALAFETLVLKIKNNEPVFYLYKYICIQRNIVKIDSIVFKLCIVMRSNVLFDRWMT